MEERDGERRRAFIGTSPLLSPPHEPLGTSNIQHPTPNRQSMALETIGCSMLDVGCWMFSFGSWVQCANFSGNSLPIRWGEGFRGSFLPDASLTRFQFPWRNGSATGFQCYEQRNH